MLRIRFFSFHFSRLMMVTSCVWLDHQAGLGILIGDEGQFNILQANISDPGTEGQSSPSQLL